MNPVAGSILAQEDNLNQLDSESLVDVTYLILRFEYLWFQTRIFFFIFPL